MAAKIGVIHYNFPGFDLERFISWCGENSVEYVELQRRDFGEDRPEREAEKIVKLLEQNKVKVSQVTVCNDFLQPAQELFAAQVRVIQTAGRLAGIFGVKQLRLDGGWPKEGVKETEHKPLVRRGIKEALEIAAKEDLYLALDNHGTLTNDFDFQLELLEGAHSKRLGANLDTMNYRWYGYPVEKLPEIYRRVAPYALHTHLKDGTGSRENYKGAALGEGEIPLQAALEALKNAGYKGVYCAEYEGPELADGAGYRKCVDWLRKTL